MIALPTIIAMLLLAVLALGSARLIAQAVRTPTAGYRRPRGWRVATLIALHALSAALLWLTLFPPLRSGPGTTLTVYSAEADANSISSKPAIALPEAPERIDAERVPDLATALRRQRNITQLHVIGDGLRARDRSAARGLDLRFSPGPLPDGLIELDWPHWPRSGQNWQLRGRVSGSIETRAALIGPDDSVIDRTGIDANGRFVLNAQARSPGQAIYHLRLLDADEQPRETHAIPLATLTGDPMRVALRAGGTNADLKYLRRWMRDASLQLHSDLRISPEVSLRSEARELTSDALADIDVLILDDRAWYGLASSEREAVLNAAHSGLGVLVLLSGEPDRAQRQQLAQLGFAVEPADLTRAVRLADQQYDEASTPSASDTRREPELSRRALRVVADNSQPMLRAADGEALALWRTMGRGRVALWWLTNSYRLVLSGASYTHANLWRDALSVIARPRAVPAPQFTPALPREGERVSICANGQLRVQAGADAPIALLADTDRNATPCAGFWPQHSGWHVLHSDDIDWPFYVYERDALPTLRAWRDRQATRELATFAANPRADDATSKTRASPFPYALAWLLSLVLLWGLERWRAGFSGATPPL